MKFNKLQTTIFLFTFGIFIMNSFPSSASQITPLETLKPRVGVGVIIVKEGKILMGKRKGSHGVGLWGFPGGHLEFGESVEQCALREVEEETGLRCTSIRLGPWVENVMEKGTKHYITLFAIVDEFEGEPSVLEPEKCEAWEWHPLERLPSPLFSPIPSLIEKEGIENLQKMIIIGSS